MNNVMDLALVFMVSALAISIIGILLVQYELRKRTLEGRRFKELILITSLLALYAMGYLGIRMQVDFLSGSMESLFKIFGAVALLGFLVFAYKNAKKFGGKLLASNVLAGMALTILGTLQQITPKDEYLMSYGGFLIIYSSCFAILIIQFCIFCGKDD